MNEAVPPTALPKGAESCSRGNASFEGPGALEEVARLAAEWFQRHLRSDTVA